MKENEGGKKEESKTDRHNEEMKEQNRERQKENEDRKKEENKKDRMKKGKIGRQRKFSSDFRPPDCTSQTQVLLIVPTRLATRATPKHWLAGSEIAIGQVLGPADMNQYSPS